MMAGRPPSVGVRLDAAEELRADDRAGEIAVADLHLAAARSTAMRAEAPVPVGERSILPGWMTTALAAVSTPSRRSTGAAIWQKENVRPVGVGRMGEAELLVGGAGDADAGLGKVARLVRRDA